MPRTKVKPKEKGRLNAIMIRKEDIERTTDKAALIKMQNHTALKGWKFWHPLNMIQNDGHPGGLLSLYAYEAWEFNAFLSLGTYKQKKTLTFDQVLSLFRKL